MGRLKRIVSLYLSCAGVVIRTDMAHRASFIAGVIGQWLSYGASFLTIFVLVENFGTLAGWSGGEVLFLYAFNLIAYAIAATFFFNSCRNLPTKVRTGEFDAALVKPVSPLAHELYMGYNFGYIGHAILSVATLFIASHRIGLTWTLGRVAMLLPMLAGAALVQASLLLISAAASFRLIGNNPLMQLLFDTMRRGTQYPITIYGLTIQFILTFVLPGAFMNFYPSVAVMGKADATPFGPVLPYLTPLVGLGLFLLARWIWYAGLKQYQSTGT